MTFVPEKENISGSERNVPETLGRLRGEEPCAPFLLRCAKGVPVLVLADVE
jgi:hypothetical protein